MLLGNTAQSGGSPGSGLKTTEISVSIYTFVHSDRLLCLWAVAIISNLTASSKSMSEIIFSPADVRLMRNKHSTLIASQLRWICAKQIFSWLFHITFLSIFQYKNREGKTWARQAARDDPNRDYWCWDRWGDGKRTEALPTTDVWGLLCTQAG